MEHFDLLTTPLEGAGLIEASAGTGKTYTITGLILRLILEKHFTIGEILVVTFTEAATQELKARIQTRLHEAIRIFSGGQSNDKFLNRLVEKLQEKRPDDAYDMITALEEAVRDFDEAAIFTIHGFCKRMLHENAFESGSLFDTELVKNQESLKQEIVEDFWRIRIYGESPLFVNYLLEKKMSPDKLLSFLKNRIFQPDMRIIPEPENADFSEQERRYKELFETMRHYWVSVKKDIEELLGDKGLNKNKYNPKSIPGWIRAMEEWLSCGKNDLQLFDKFDKFTRSGIEYGTRKYCSPPEHSFFEFCERFMSQREKLRDAFEQRILSLKTDLFAYMKKELRKRKEAQNIFSYDDLLLNLQRALREQGESLTENIRSRFKAALIDEFQDTDPVQYDIFRQVFRGYADENRPILFLIGDPKQAIYGFRGADIFAYMDAKAETEPRYTLRENWRSEPDLVRAVNTVFENADSAFIYDDIPFEQVDAASDKSDQVFLSINGKPEPPFQFWFVPSGEKDYITKGDAQKMILQGVAAEISRILDREARVFLGEEPLRPGDIAVLVRKNIQAQLMQESLSALNIPAVLHSDANIFESHEALEMERVLSAIAQPNNERRLKTALATDMIGLSGEALDAFAENEAAYESWLLKFRGYHNTWNTFGFIQMFRQFMTNEKIRSRLMSLADGERRTTNILHLSELLHKTWTEKNPGMSWLIRWLSDQRGPDRERLDEHQLRLESDENAVRLVTVHKSKGLEYPVVFVPFMYDGSESNDEDLLFHDETYKRKLTLDLGSDQKEEHRRFTERELLAENLRLLYVALTRSKNRCYLIWGRFNKAETSALAYLFHNPNAPEQDILGTTASRFRTLSDEEMFADLVKIRDKSRGAIALSEIPTEPGVPYSPVSGEPEKLDYRRFSADIDSNFRVASFSSLISGRTYHAETADYDADTLREIPEEYEEPEEQEPISDIFSFPRGKRAGTFLHDVFEHLDFTQEDPVSLKNLVGEKLREYDFAPEWTDAICDTVRKTLSAPLVPDDATFTLSRIKNEDRLNELGFYFPLNEISGKRLSHIMSRYNPQPATRNLQDFSDSVERLEFTPTKGFMKGFIDMVFCFREKFYLVDWKSNFLGTGVDAYHQESLYAAMKTHYYILQYMIYTLALHQYLFVRKPGYDYDRDFGGVFYIFLRGVDPEKGPDFGIYRDKPAEGLINALSERLISR